MSEDWREQALLIMGGVYFFLEDKCPLGKWAYPYVPGMVAIYGAQSWLLEMGYNPSFPEGEGSL